MEIMEGRTRFIGGIVLGVVIFILDRILKAVALSYDGSAFLFSPKVPIFFERFENPFLAFSIPLLPSVGVVLALLAFIVLVLRMVWGIRRKQYNEIPFFFSIFVGAVSNIYDRILYGFVVDYLHIFILPVFNLADILIAVGIIFLLLQGRVIPTSSQQV